VRLTFVDHQSTLGKTPRNFAIDPSGRFILAANQDTDTIVTFGVDAASGKLEPTGDTVSTGRSGVHQDRADGSDVTFRMRVAR